jgi:hypothetical protein
MGIRTIEVEPAEAFTAVLDRFRRRFGSKHSTVRLDRLIVHSTSTSLGSANIGADQDGHKGRFYPMNFYALVRHQWETTQTRGQEDLQAHVFLNQ